MSVHEHNGKVYVDSDFINIVQRKYPNSELKHLGFGEFYLVTPDGKIEFDRMRGEHMDWEGKVGRGHLMYDDSNGKAVEKALHYMKNASKLSRKIAELEHKLASK